MYRSILVPLDGSATAELALPVAAEIARRTDAALRLVRVLRPDAPPLPWAGGLPVEQGERELAPTADHRRAQDYVDAAVARLVEQGIAATGTLRLGDAAPELAREAAVAQADLVVMTTHGRGLSRAVLGSVTQELVRRSAVPVLTVRARTGTVARSPDAPSRILVPLDGSPLDEHILQQAARIGGVLRGEVLLLRMVTPHVHRDRPTAVQFDRGEVRQLHESADRELQPVRARLEEGGMTVRTHVVAGERAEEEILDFAARHDVSLIVMATHARQGRERLVHGSVAEAVLRGATADVLLYHPQVAGA